MPLCAGYTLARNVRENDKKVPILFMTARDDKPSFQLGYQAGIDDYITKPYNPNILLLRIGAVLKRSENTSPLLSYKDLKINMTSI